MVAGVADPVLHRQRRADIVHDVPEIRVVRRRVLREGLVPCGTLDQGGDLGQAYLWSFPLPVKQLPQRPQHGPGIWPVLRRSGTVSHSRSANGSQKWRKPEWDRRPSGQYGRIGSAGCRTS